MKVLHITTHLDIGGVTRYVFDLASGLKSHGVECFVASSGGSLSGRFVQSGLKLFTVDIRTKFEFHPKLVRAVITLKKYVKDNNIDILHAHTRVSQVIAQVVSWHTGIPFVSTCHGFFKSDRLSRRLFPCWGMSVIAISAAVKEHLVRDFRLEEELVKVIYSGVDVDEYGGATTDEDKAILRKKAGVPAGPVIGAIGRLSPVKGYKYLLHAYREVKETHSNANLIIIGDGPCGDELRRIAGDLKISDSVFFIKSDPEARKYYAIMDVYVFPSIQEGLGFALLEAMASGKACVAASVGGISNVIEDGKNGLLVRPKVPGDLALSVKKLLSDSGLNSALGRAARHTISEKFTRSGMIDKTFEFYTRVSGTHA